MSEAFTLEILVPSGKVLSERVESVTLPGEMGQVGVLPGHAAYTTTLGTGLLEYTKVGSHSSEAMVISGGIAQMEGDGLRILADTVDLKDKITRGEYDKDRLLLEENLAHGDITTPEWAIAKAKMDRIQAIDTLIGSGAR